MLRTKIIASQVQNLTDARYFAAWGVEYMTFSIDTEPINLTDIKEIMEWVEGPIFAVEYNNDITIDLINSQLQALEIDHVIVSTDSVTPLRIQGWETVEKITVSHLDQTSSDRRYILCVDTPYNGLSQSDKKAIAYTAEDSKLYIDAPFTTVDLDAWIALGITGIVLRGSEEEKVGVKSYHDLDDIMEALEID